MNCDPNGAAHLEEADLGLGPNRWIPVLGGGSPGRARLPTCALAPGVISLVEGGPPIRSAQDLVHGGLDGGAPHRVRQLRRPRHGTAEQEQAHPRA